MTTTLRGKVNTTFPSSVTGESPIIITNTGGNYVISLDIDEVQASLDFVPDISIGVAAQPLDGTETVPGIQNDTNVDILTQDIADLAIADSLALSALPAASALGGTELLYAVQGGVDVKVTATTLVGSPSLATNATTGFLYVPACAGTPIGTPTTVTGKVPIVVDSTNNKLYFYSGGAWRDAGP